MKTISFKKFAKFFAEKPKIDNLLRTLQYDLQKYVRKPPQDEEDLKDIVYNLCLQLDSNTARDRPKEFYLGVYTVNFVLWDNLVALEVKLIKHKNQLQKTLTEIISHIPPYANLFSHVIFLLYDASNAIDNADEIKKDIEARGDNITMIIVKHQLPKS